jgi:predicted DNA-binding protein (MmcQ/YjbR family)
VRAAEAEEELIQRFRTMCLELPEASEVSSWGHPNFRAGKKTFATVEWFKGRPSFAFKVGAPDVARLQRQRANTFTTPYGRGEWISIWIDRRVNWRLIETLAEQSYRLVALKRMTAVLDGVTRQRVG